MTHASVQFLVYKVLTLAYRRPLEDLGRDNIEDNLFPNVKRAIPHNGSISMIEIVERALVIAPEHFNNKCCPDFVMRAATTRSTFAASVVKHCNARMSSSISFPDRRGNR